MISLFAALALLHGAQESVPGSLIPNPGVPARPAEGRTDTLEARRVMSDFGLCTVRRNRRGVERFLRIDAASPGFGQEGARLASADCLHGGTLRFQPAIFRGALYGALYRVDFRSRAPVDIRDAPAIDYGETDLASASERRRSWVAWQMFADCVVRANEVGARNLVLSDIGSAGENAAFAALHPMFEACLTEGVVATFNHSILRGLVSEGLYRLSLAASVGR
ncbi:MAG: hypothetical protein KF780_09955 [Sphingomonas sp.]|nr:hypothetical protein [Sphingomonas sp.]